MTPAREGVQGLLESASVHLGRREFREAQLAFVAALKLDPECVPALMGYARVMHDTQRPAAAAAVYQRVLEVEPENLHANVNLASLHRADHRPGDALPLLKAALRVDPDCEPAHREMAQVLSDLRDEEGAWEHGRRALRDPIVEYPYDGVPGQAVELLALCGWQAVNTPMEHAMDPRGVRLTKLNVDFFDPARPLPRHHVVWNLIGEVEIGGRHLRACEEILKRVRAPVLNPPPRIWPTSRAGNAQRLAGIPDLVVPRIRGFQRRDLEGAGAVDALRAAGFGFPLLIRAAGFQGGLNFVKVEGPEGLGEALRAMPGDELTVHEFVDARDADGRIRKYRVVMVDGRLYPVHAAVAGQWKIHYFSAGMRDSPENRAEDRAFLEDMEGVLGPKAMAALGAVRDTLALDYGGIDFSLAQDGSVVFFEANATMVVPRPDRSEVWDYRRAPIARIHAAMTAMVASRAGRTLRLPGAGLSQAAPTAIPNPGRRGPSLKAGPPTLLLRLAQATGLQRAGLLPEARREIEAVLRDDPESVEGLLSLGALLLEMGDPAAAVGALARAGRLAPTHAGARAAEGRALLALGRTDEARTAFESALSLDPGQSEAHLGLSLLAAAVGDLARAKFHGRSAARGRSYRDLPFKGAHGPRVLVLASALGGNAPLDRLIDPRGFQVSVLTLEYHEPGEALPIHDLLFNATGGPDLRPRALELARAVAALSSAPRLNDPERCLGCARTGLDARLAGIPGLAVRTQGGVDGGTLRRVLVVAGHLHALEPEPVGSAPPPEAAFLNDPAGFLGAVAAAALRRAALALGLDYVAFDCVREAAGAGILVLGADPAAAPAFGPLPEGDPRAAAARRIAESVNDLLRSRQKEEH